MITLHAVAARADRMERALPLFEDRFPDDRRKKASDKVTGFFYILVRPAGFEPTTPWFVAKYSIQLSYGRCEEKNYSRIFRMGKIRG